MTDISGWAHLAASAAAFGAGLVNAVAGGGTLITFPVLTAIGVPSVRANATNTVSLLPAFVGGVAAQRSELAALRGSIRPQMIAAACGGLAGSILLVVTSDAVFRQVVPFLILVACLLMAAQDRIRDRIFAPGKAHQSHPVLQVLTVFAAAVYGGYFGAGLGIMLLAVLGLFSEQPFSQLNVIKLVLAFIANLAAATFLSLSGEVQWSLVMVMAPAALLGGNVGGRVARVVASEKMRMVVIVLGVTVAVIYLLK